MPRSTRTWKNTALAARTAFVVATLAGCNALSGIDDFYVGSSSSSSTTDSSSPSKGRDGSSTSRPPFEPVEVDASGADAGNTLDEDADNTSDDASGGDDAERATKHVFVTNGTMSGNIGGLALADQYCTSAAKAAGLSGSWIAWLSDPETNAINRIAHNGAYALLDGTIVVESKRQLTSGRILHAIDMTENEVTLPANRGVWTGTRPDGTSDATCSGWTTNAAASIGTLASAKAVDIGWTKGAPQSGLTDNWRCNTVVSLYCFER